MRKGRQPKNISLVVDNIITVVESQLDGEIKFAIKTETVKTMVKSIVPIRHKNPHFEYLMEVGLSQVIEQRLYQRGYRSICKGLFINLEKCNDPYEVFRLLKHEAKRADGVNGMYDQMLKKLKELCDGTSRIIFNEKNEPIGIAFAPTEEEFMAKLEAGAI